MNFHAINRLEDESILLRKILNLQTEIRAKHENERVSKNEDTRVLSRIFDPITSEMRTIKDALDIGSSSSSSTRQRQHKIAKHRENLLDLDTEIKNDAKFIGDDDDDDDVEEDEVPPIENPKPIQTTKYRKHRKQMRHINNPVDNSYTKALQSVKSNYRGDGYFGLDVKKKLVGGLPYNVDGNRLSVDVGSGKDKVFQIDDIDVWKWLLLKNPESQLPIYDDGDDGGGKPTAAFRQYKDIADSLNLIDWARSSGLSEKTYSQKRKYKLLINNPKGKGFLFTARPPSHIIQKKKSGKKRKNNDDVNAGGRGLTDVMAAHRCSPDVVVIPTNNRALMEKLARCMGEIDAGNSSLVNIAVPLKEEAARRGLISADNPVFKDLNWTLA